MRRGYKGNFLYDSAGTLVGIDLGADFCAEHEWGIDGLVSDFGRQPAKSFDKLGLAARTVTALPPHLTLVDEGSTTALYATRLHTYGTPEQQVSQIRDRQKYLLDGELKIRSGSLATGWDERSFGIHASDEKGRGHLRELHKAFKRLDVAIWLGGGGVFENAGLVLAIVSRVPAERSEIMRAADEDRQKLAVASKKTGIEDLLARSKKQYLALRPGWFKGGPNNGRKSKHPVMYLLNPMDQRLYDTGWFTVEELEQWAQNKGPVIKTEKERRA